MEKIILGIMLSLSAIYSGIGIAKADSVIAGLGRYHNLSTTNNNSINNNNDNSRSPSYFNELASFYKENSRKPLFDWDKPLFGHKHNSLEKVLANANNAIEKSTNFLNKIKSRQIACANRAKSIPENATIRKEYIKCRKEICEQKHGPLLLCLLERF